MEENVISNDKATGFWYIDINACMLLLDYIIIMICLMLPKNILFIKMTDAHLRPPHHDHHKLASLQVPFANWQVVNVVFNYPVIKLLSVLFVLTKDFHPTPLLIPYDFSSFFGLRMTSFQLNDSQKPSQKEATQDAAANFAFCMSAKSKGKKSIIECWATYRKNPFKQILPTQYV